MTGRTTGGMKGAIRSEVRKMMSVRTTYLLAAGAAGLAVVTVVGTGGAAASELAKPLHEQQSWLFTVLLTRLLFVLLGIRLITEEYRYGTLTPSLLAIGSRGRLLCAKLVAASAVAVVMAVLAQLALVAAVTVSAAQRSVSVAITADDARAMLGMVAAAALYAAVGVGIGTIARQPVPVTVGAVFWLLLGEELLAVNLPDAVDVLPGYAGMGLAASDVAATGPGPLAGAVVLLAWAATAALAAAALLHRRDVA